jgi:regulator of nucleoside diphosphate kinase
MLAGGRAMCASACRLAGRVLRNRFAKTKHQQHPTIIKTMNTIMNTRIIYITEADRKRLRPLIEAMKNSRDDIRALESELAQAEVVAPADVPPDIVTMNSRLRLRDLDTGEELTYTLVFPDQASIDDGRISVVAPVGTAMLGHRVGDEFDWEVPAGRVRFRVEELLYQPEAAGHFHL